MVINKRSPNIQDKPNAKRWVAENPSAARVFETVKAALLALYAGGLEHGYVNFNRGIQYRFATGDGQWLRVEGSSRTIAVKLSKLSTDRVIHERKISVADPRDVMTLLQKFLATANPEGFRTALLSVGEDFGAEVEAASKDSIARRRARLERADAKPEVVYQVVLIRKRNPDVVAERLYLARQEGLCGRCKNPAPFFGRDGLPYFEVHHIIQLAHGGPDTVANTIAVCPNCHREMHYGSEVA